MSATALQQLACEQSRATMLDSAACLLAAFRRIGVPVSMLDAGCGAGHLVKIALAIGVRAVGIDCNPGLYDEPYSFEPHFLVRDLTEPMAASVTPVELVLCLEVAEHLPPESAGTLCDTLAAATGKTLLFSAATPGQGGAGHLNEQPHGYWRALLTACGLVEDEVLTADLRREWAACAPRAWWYSRNCLAFRRPA